MRRQATKRKAKRPPLRRQPPKPEAKEEPKRVATGIPGLDPLIEGGFVRNSTVLVRGDTGTAKTLFCIQYLYEGALAGEPGVFISFAESREAIYEHGRKFGWDLDVLARKGLFEVIRYDPHEVVKIMQEGGGLIRDTIESKAASRLAIDSLSAYELFFENKYRSNQSVLSLFEMLKKWNVTAMVTSEMPVSLSSETRDRLGFLTEGIINLYHMRSHSERLRVLEILKMRDTRHNEGLYHFTIEKTGLRVRGRLSGFGRP